jgi:uncharacterized phage protein gp47/JayE
MASQLKVDTLTGVTTAGSIVVTGEGNSTTTNLQQGLAKCWSVFDQVNSNTLDDNFNITNVTDRGTGSMYGNFTNNMASINYTVMGATSPSASGSMGTANTNRSTISSADTTSRYSLNVYTDSAQGMFDEENQQALVHGDLA